MKILSNKEISSGGKCLKQEDNGEVVRNIASQNSKDNFYFFFPYFYETLV